MRGVVTRAAARVLAVLAVATFAVALTATPGMAAPRAEWPQFQGDAGHTGWDRGESILTPANVGDLQLAWSAFSESFNPVEAGGLLFKIGNVPTSLDALDGSTGDLVWRSGPRLSGEPGVSGSLVYVTQPNQLLALDAASGRKVWSTPTDQELNGPPVISDGVVFEISSGLATLYAFDAATGAILWSFRVPDGGPIPAVAGHRLFQVSGSRLFALNPANGRVLWKVREPTLRGGTNVVANAGGVYLTGSDGAVHAFDPVTGARLWRSPKSGYSNLVVDGRHVFAVSWSDGLFTSFDAATGAVRWATTQGGASFFRPPVVGGGMLLDVADNGQIVALRTADGTRVPLNLSVGTFGSLALVQGNLYVQAGITLFKFALPAG